MPKKKAKKSPRLSPKSGQGVFVKPPVEKKPSAKAVREQKLQKLREQFEINRKKDALKLKGIRKLPSNLRLEVVEVTAEFFHEALDGDTNDRPIGKKDVKRWRRIHLEERGELNGMTIVRDSEGHFTNAWHRGTGLIEAQEEENRIAKEEGREPRILTFPVVLVQGVDPKSTATTDTGKERKHRDVLYSQASDLIEEEVKLQGEDPLNDSQLRQLCGHLGVMSRAVYCAVHGVTIQKSQSIKYDHDEMLSFIQEHTATPKGKDRGVSMLGHLVYCFCELDGRGKAGGKGISNAVTLPMFAAITYLARVAETEVAQVRSDQGQGIRLAPASEGVLDDRHDVEITEFMKVFADQMNADIDHPARALKRAFTDRRKRKGTLDRDETNDLIRLALCQHLEGVKPDGELKIRESDGEMPFRLMGFDISREEIAEFLATGDAEDILNQPEEAEEDEDEAGGFVESREEAVAV